MKIRKGDLIILVVVVIIGVGGIIYNQRSLPDPTKSSQVAIELSGEVISSYPLQDISEVFTVETEHGYNIVEIEGDQVRIQEADCRDQICVYFGWAAKPGQAIVCLPHELVVRVIEEESDEFSLDGVTY